MRMLVAIAMVWACACGKTHDATDGGSDFPVTDFLPEVSKVYCDLLVSCGVVDDVATCEMLYLDLKIPPDVVAAIAAGKVIYHSDKARACVEGIKAWTCDRTVVFTNRAQPAICDEIFEGTIGDQGVCALDEECISQSCGVPACSEACCQGTCSGGTAPVRPIAGESCATNRSCVDSFCDLQTDLCTAYLAAGATCLSAAQCAPSLTCNANVCEALVADGGACTGPTQCLNVGMTCSTSSMTCVAVGLSGAPCTMASDCSSFYTCGPNSACVLRPRLGEACTTSCIDLSYCDATTRVCTAPQADGATCNSNKQCASTHCDGTTQTCSTPATCI